MIICKRSTNSDDQLAGPRRDGTDGIEGSIRGPREPKKGNLQFETRMFQRDGQIEQVPRWEVIARREAAVYKDLFSRYPFEHPSHV